MMGLKSSASFRGLTQLTAALQRGRARWPAEADKLTKKAGNQMLALYQANLSGSSPSTSAKPLPVGVVTGDLLAGAVMEQVNQYRADIKNDDFKAAFLEFGTVHMSARRPLSAAVEDYTGGDLPNDANQVMAKIWRE